MSALDTIAAGSLVTVVAQSYGKSIISVQSTSHASSTIVMVWNASAKEFDLHADNLLETSKLGFSRLPHGTYGLVISASLDVNSMAWPGTFDMVLIKDKIYIIRRQNLKLVK